MTSSFVEKQHLEPYARLDPTRLHAEFHDKSVLITGGGAGIGAAIAQAFAQAGVASIIICGRTEEQLKSTTTALTDAFPRVKVEYRVADIASPASITNLFSTIKDRVDVLVNNAASFPTPANFMDADLDEWWKTFEVNIYGVALTIREFLRQRQQAQPNGPATVITVNTAFAYSALFPSVSAYSASKAGAARMMELIAIEVPQSVARFISVHPGSVNTAMAAKAGNDGSVFPFTDARLTAEFIVWTASQEADFLAGRFAWVNWDVDELISKKEAILRDGLLLTSLKET